VKSSEVSSGETKRQQWLFYETKESGMILERHGSSAGFSYPDQRYEGGFTPGQNYYNSVMTTLRGVGMVLYMYDWHGFVWQC